MSASVQLLHRSKELVQCLARHHAQLPKHACVNCDRDAVVCMCTQCHAHPSSAFKWFLHSPKSRAGLQSHHGQLSKHACVNCDRDAVVCMCTQCHTHPSSAFKYFLYSPKSRVGLCSLDRECPTCAFVEVSTFLDGRGAHLQDMTPQQLFRLRGTAAMPEFKAGEQCDAMEFVRCLLGFTRSDPPPDCPLVVNVTQTTTCKVCGYTRDKARVVDGRAACHRRA